MSESCVKHSYTTEAAALPLAAPQLKLHPTHTADNPWISTITPCESPETADRHVPVFIQLLFTQDTLIPRPSQVHFHKLYLYLAVCHNIWKYHENKQRSPMSANRYIVPCVHGRCLDSACEKPFCRVTSYTVSKKSMPFVGHKQIAMGLNSKPSEMKNAEMQLCIQLVLFCATNFTYIFPVGYHVPYHSNNRQKSFTRTNIQVSHGQNKVVYLTKNYSAHYSDTAVMFASWYTLKNNLKMAKPDYSLKNSYRSCAKIKRPISIRG